MHIIGRNYPIWLNHHSQLDSCQLRAFLNALVASVADPHRAHSYTEWLTCRVELSAELAHNFFSRSIYKLMLSALFLHSPTTIHPAKMKITLFIASAILAYGAVAAPVQSSSPLEKNSRENQKHEIEDLHPISTFVTPRGFIEPIPEYPHETTKTSLPFDNHPDNSESFLAIIDNIPGDEMKSQTKTTVSPQHGYPPVSGSHHGGYHNTNLRDLLDKIDFKESVCIEKQAHERLQKHSKRSDPRAEKVVGLLKRLDILNSAQTLDEKMAEIIIDELESYLRTYRAKGWKYDAPHVEVAAIHKAEDHLHGLNLTRDATLRHGEKLRDLCYQIDGSYHRKEACARGIMENGIVRNLTAGLGKRAVSEDTSGDVAASQPNPGASPSLTGQPPSVETSVSQFTLAYCPGESDWKPAEQFSDVSDCARLIRDVKTSELERRQDDPAWFDKFISPEYENTLPKRNDRRWDFEGSMSMEFEDPKSHETTDVDLEANWFSDWKRALAQGNEESHTSSAKQDATPELADRIRNLEDEIGTEITKPFNELKNATENATGAIQDAVERFAARVNKHNSHSSGKLNFTATFYPSKYCKRDLAESVKKAEDEIAAKIREGYDHITAPVTVTKNCTYNVTAVGSIPVKHNATARFNPTWHYKRGLPESVRKLENEIGSKITEPYNEVTQPLTEFKNSTERGLHRLAHKAENLTTKHPYGKEGSPANENDDLERIFAEHYKSPAFRDFLHRVFNITSGNRNSTSCPYAGSHDKSATNHTSSSSCGEGTCGRIHAKDFKQSGKHLSPRERAKYCAAHKYGTNTPEFEFSQHHSAEVFDRMVDIMDMKHKASNRYDEDRFISKAEQRLRVQQLMLEYDEAGFDPSTAVAKPIKKTLY
jgi:hypothetical protein